MMMMMMMMLLGVWCKESLWNIYLWVCGVDC